MTENQCSKCQKSFSNKYTLQTHLKTHENRDRPFACECGKKFLNQRHLDNHKSTIHEGKARNFVCDICMKTFKSQSNLTTHQEAHSEPRFLCRFCDKTFSRQANVKIHEKTHTNEKNFKCSECDKEFGQQSNLLSHVKTVHKQIKNHNCNLCEKSYKRRRLLNYHQLAAHGDESVAMKLKCGSCDFSTVYPSHLLKHKKLCRPSEK